MANFVYVNENDGRKDVRTFLLNIDQITEIFPANGYDGLIVYNVFTGENDYIAISAESYSELIKYITKISGEIPKLS